MTSCDLVIPVRSAAMQQLCGATARGILVPAGTQAPDDEQLEAIETAELGTWGTAEHGAAGTTAEHGAAGTTAEHGAAGTTAEHGAWSTVEHGATESIAEHGAAGANAELGAAGGTVRHGAGGTAELGAGGTVKQGAGANGSSSTRGRGAWSKQELQMTSAALDTPAVHEAVKSDSPNPSAAMWACRSDRPARLDEQARAGVEVQEGVVEIVLPSANTEHRPEGHTIHHNANSARKVVVKPKVAASVSELLRDRPEGAAAIGLLQRFEKGPDPRLLGLSMHP